MKKIVLLTSFIFLYSFIFVKQSWATHVDWDTNYCNDGSQKQTFFSSSMQTNIGYYIHLPPGYNANDSSTRYPVIYHLHGVNGNECNYDQSVGNNNPAHLNNLIDSGQIPPTIAVYINGGKWIFYQDDNVGTCSSSKHCPETMFISELIPHIDNNYNTIANKQGRAIQGFSMGGMGSLYYATKYPNLFSSVAGMSSGCYADTNTQFAPPNQAGKCNGGNGYIGQTNQINSFVNSANFPKDMGFQLTHGVQANGNCNEAGVICSFQDNLFNTLNGLGLNTSPSIYRLNGLTHHPGDHQRYLYNNKYVSLITAQFHWQFFGSSPLPSPTPSPPPSPSPSPSPSLSPTPTASNINGDINGDFSVDESDYNQLISFFGWIGNPGDISSDINNDGVVNIFDINILVNNFGS